MSEINFPSKDQLIEKWSPVLELKEGWAEKVGDAPKIDASKEFFVSTMLEQLEQTVLKENVPANGGTRSGNIAKYDPILIPMVRRIMPALIGPEIFGTQPMVAPTGLIFALKSIYAGDANDPMKRANSKILFVTDGSVFAAGDEIVGSDSAAEATVRYVEGNKILVEVIDGEFNTDDEFTVGMDTIEVVDIVENEALFKTILKNYTGTYTTADGEILGKSTKEIGFEISRSTVEANTRKLKARWTEEMEEDLAAVHGMSAQQLMSTIASDEITLEMNREFIDLIDAEATANSVITWNYASADGRWELEKYQNLIATINRQRREVAVDTRRGQANWVIVTPGVLSALEATGKMSMTGIDPMVTSFAGMLMGTIRVYVDIWQTTEQILVGYKGNTEVDAGMYYAPYIPLKISVGRGEEDNIPRMFFHTRYGVGYNPLSRQYFRKILVTGLPV